MSGATHGGKGSGRRPESEAGAYARGYDAIFGPKPARGGNGCPCEPSGSDGLTCPDANGRLLCEDRPHG